jgi:CheY-like chemotaxis protein
MDVHMPVMDGVAASEAIRGMEPPASQVRIVALTADVFADTRERCLRAGINEVITKPVSLPDLTALLARHFGSAEGPAATEAAAATTAVESPPRQAPLLDPGALRHVTELMGPDRAPVLYASFFEQADDAARRMREAMRAADVEEVRRAAHAVKGAALNLGLPALAEAAAGLNNDAATLGPAPLALAVQRYEELVAATRAVCAAEGLVDSSSANA